MYQRYSFYGMVLIGVTCLSIIVLSRRYNINDENSLQTIVLQEIEVHLNQQRLEIEREMEGYHYEDLSGKNIIGKLSDLVIQTGGTPIRSVVLSTWRSGSSFLGDLISAHPASYYTFEPLLGVFGISRLKSPLSSPKPLNILESLFKCNFENLGELLDYRKTDVWNSNDYNRYFSKIYREIGNICYHPEFATRFCSLFPFQTMKIVGIDLASMKYFLENKNLGLKLIYLVRDPRGVMNSRRVLDWCKLIPDCFYPAMQCSNILLDYNTAIEFSQKYPDTFKVLRYEDFSSDPDKISRKIYEFYGMNYHEDVKKFVDAHTKVSHGNAYSTYRNTSSVVYQWTEQLRFHQVHEIQEQCHEAMRVWGYEVAIDSHHQKTFNPLKPLSTKDINYF